MLCVLLRTGFPIASWTLLIAGILVFTRVRGLAGELKTGCSRRGSETIRGLPRSVRVHFAGQVIETGQRRLGAKNKAESDQKRLDARRFWRSLPPSSTFKLSLAVFFAIAAIGFATDLFNPVGKPFYTVLVSGAYDGLGALAFLWVGKRRPRWIAAVIAAFIVTTIALNRAMPSYRGRLAVPADLQMRLILDGIFMLVTINVGYTLFVIFIQTAGFKHMRNQTELELAERLQTTLVPPLSLRTDRVSIEARSIASSKMGGDLADALQSGGVTTCYVADVSGHGVAAGV